MGKNNGNSWLNAVRKAFRSPTKLENDHEEDKKTGKRRWTFLKNYPLETTIQHNVGKTRMTDPNLATKQADQSRAIAMAMAAAAEATARAAVDIIRLTTMPSPSFIEHKAALVIQTIFRGYLARRALMALKGIVKLQALIRAHIVRKRAKMTLQCIQSLVRVQTHVCDQRRRRSCEETSKNNYISNSDYDHRKLAVEEIQGLIQKANECSFKPGKKTLRHILSQQIPTFDEEQFSDNNYQKTRKDRTMLFNLSVQSPKTPSSSTTSSIGFQSAETPTSRSIYYHRLSMSESSCPLPRPNYMAATASAIARVRSHSTSRNRPSSPSRDQTGFSAKKRLSFPVNDPENTNNRRYKGISTNQGGYEQRLEVPCYLTE